MSVIIAGRDFTIRWSFRAGDMLAWLRAPEIAEGATDFTLADFWYFKDGDHVIISNRPVDFPDWFTLHPTEVADEETENDAADMKDEFDLPDVVDGPNLWRVRAGDRLVWVGERGTSSSAGEGVLGVLDCRTNVLVAGDGHHNTLMGWLAFGDQPGERLTGRQTMLLRSGVTAAINLGASRAVSDDWTIG